MTRYCCVPSRCKKAGLPAISVRESAGREGITGTVSGKEASVENRGSNRDGDGDGVFAATVITEKARIQLIKTLLLVNFCICQSLGEEEAHVREPLPFMCRLFFILHPRKSSLLTGLYPILLHSCRGYKVFQRQDRAGATGVVSHQLN